MPVKTTVLLRNWEAAPEWLRPTALVVDGRHGKRVLDRPGAFLVDLIRDETVSAEILLYAPGVGTVMSAIHCRWNDGELHADIPTSGFVRVQVESELGGEAVVSAYLVVPGPFFPDFPLPRRLRAWSDGDFRFARGSTVVCAASAHAKSSPSGLGTFWGFFLVDGAAGDQSFQLGGRWVDVEPGSAGILTAQASLGGSEVEWTLVHDLRGVTRVWLPDSVQSLQLDASNRRVRIMANTVGKLLRLP